MAQSPNESKIPVFHSGRIRSRFSKPFFSLSNKVREHLNTTKIQSSTSPSVFFGILNSSPKSPVHVSSDVHAVSEDNATKPAIRPTSFGRQFPEYEKSKVENVDDDNNCVGKRVRLSSKKEGALKYFGETEFNNEGVCCGVELDKTEISNDGSFGSVRYFKGSSGNSTFSFPSKVPILPSDVCEQLDSGPHSLLEVTRELPRNDNIGGCSKSDTFESQGGKSIRYSGSDILFNNKQKTTLTPTGSYNGPIPPDEWKICSQYSSSGGSLGNSSRETLSCIDLMTSSLQMSKHSSLECDESLGILTPDQMAEFAGAGSSGMQSNEDFLTYLEEEEKSNDDTIEELGSSTLGLYEEEVFSGMKCIDKNLQTELRETISSRFSSREIVKMALTDFEKSMESIKRNDFNCVPPYEELNDIPFEDIAHNCKTTNQSVVEVAANTTTATSFVTSVTSIGSWDNGYQGDGEGSRPTSRGAIDGSPSAHGTTIKLKLGDPMTDSDFFTESDPDVYEDVTSNIGKGDRSARIIDGMLYGGVVLPKIINEENSKDLKEDQRNQTNQSSITEEMDSSGVYSDFEKRIENSTTSSVSLEKTLTQEDVNSDTSANSSTRSIKSQKKISPINDKSEVENCKENEKSSTTEPFHKHSAVDKRENIDKNNIRSSHKVTPKITANIEPKRSSLKRVATSKVKSALNNTVSKNTRNENQENYQPGSPKCQRYVKRSAGKWDAVMSKIEKSKTEEKSNVRLKEIKSKVASGLSKDLSQSTPVTPFSTSRNINRVRPQHLSVSLSQSAKSLKDDTAFQRCRSRNLRLRATLEDSVSSSAATAPPSLSQATSPGSSISDISDPNQLDVSQRSLPNVVSVRSPSGSFKKNKNTTVCSPMSEGSLITIPSVQDQHYSKISSLIRLKTTRQGGSVNSLIENNNCDQNTKMKIQSSRKIYSRRNLPKIIPTKDQNRVSSNNGLDRANNNRQDRVKKPYETFGGKIELSKETKRKEIIIKNERDKLLNELKQTTLGMEAFAMVIHHLSTNLDAFSTPVLKMQLTGYKNDLLKARKEIDENNDKYKKLHDELMDERSSHMDKMEQLRQIHCQQLQTLNIQHTQQLQTREDEYNENLKTAKMELAKKDFQLRSNFQEDVKRIRMEAEYKLDEILKETIKQIDKIKEESMGYEKRIKEELSKRNGELEKEFAIKEEKLMNELGTLRKQHESQLKCANDELYLKEKELINKLAEYTSTNETSQEDSKVTPQFQNLEEEIRSLRTVLDLRHSEIQELRKQNQKLHQQIEDLPHVSQKLDSAQARIEDLTVQLKCKIDAEQSLLKENRKLTEYLHHELEKKKRIEFANEELQWKLKRSTQVANALVAITRNSNNNSPSSNNGWDKIHNQSTPISKNGFKFDQASDEDNVTFKRKMEIGIKRSSTENDLKLVDTEVDGAAKVLGVVEKNDSVSWVLEMDDSPTEVANRMLRRANSLRSVPSRKNSTNLSTLSHSLTLPSRIKKRTRSSSSSTGQYVKNKKNNEKSNENWQENEEEEGGGVNNTKEPDISSFFDFLNEMEDDFDQNALTIDSYSSSTYSGSSCNSDTSSLELDDYKSLRRFVETSEEDEENNIQIQQSPLKTSAGEAMVSKETSDNDLHSDSSSSDIDDGAKESIKT